MKWFISIEENEAGDRCQIWAARNDEINMQIPLYVYLPADMDTCDKVVFSIHGTKCNAQFYRDILVDFAKDANTLLIAPLLDSSMYNKPLFLNFGNMVTGRLSEAGQQPNVPEDLWAFTALEGIFLSIKDAHSSIQKFSLFGHSAGGQFAHRMAIFHDSEYLDTTIAANSGAYTVMNGDVDFPFGVKGLFTIPQLKKILAKRLVIIAGEEDVNIDKFLPTQSKQTKSQGANRLERATNFINHAQKLAQQIGAPCNWRIIYAHGVGHSAKKTAIVAAEYLFDE
jgi:hypothetical protein